MTRQVNIQTNFSVHVCFNYVQQSTKYQLNDAIGFLSTYRMEEFDQLNMIIEESGNMSAEYKHAKSGKRIVIVAHFLRHLPHTLKYRFCEVMSNGNEKLLTPSYRH